MIEQMREGTKHTHKIGGLFRRKATKKDYDFGWGFAWRRGFLIGGILFLTLSIGTLITIRACTSSRASSFSSHFSSSWRLLRWVHDKIDAELVLPYVNWLTSDEDLVLDAGCGAEERLSPLQNIEEWENNRRRQFDAPYIGDGGRRLLEQNLKVANVRDTVDIQIMT